jgi:hypothetical protein
MFSSLVNQTNTVKFLLERVLPSRDDECEENDENDKNDENNENDRNDKITLFREEITEDEIHTAIGWFRKNYFINLRNHVLSFTFTLNTKNSFSFLL